MIEPRTYCRLSPSTSSFRPWLSNTSSLSRCSSKASWYWKPEQPASAHAHPQARQRHVGLLGLEELADLLRALVGDRDHRLHGVWPAKTSKSIAMGPMAPGAARRADRGAARRGATLDLVPSPQEIKQRIETAIPGSRAEVEDTPGAGTTSAQPSRPRPSGASAGSSSTAWSTGSSARTSAARSTR